MPRATLLPRAGVERLDQAERDRRHDHDARDARGHDEGQQEIGDDQAEQDARIGDADPQHDVKASRRATPERVAIAPDQQRAEQEPGRVVGEAAERDGKADDAERPEQEAADEARQARSPSPA